MSPTIVLGSVASGVAAAAVAWMGLKPAKSLTSRVGAYSPDARSRLGLRVGNQVVVHGGPTGLRVFLPMVESLAKGLSSLIDAESEDATALRLRQAGLMGHIDASLRVGAYRLRQLLFAGLGGLGGVVISLLVGLSLGMVLLLGLLGLIVGGAKLRGTVDKAISTRRATMTLEIYTLNQLLALRIRAGGGVLGALDELVRRGRGEVVEELEEALALVRSGETPVDAFERLASTTPEPHCARTYFLLAQAQEHGSDLAEALLSLANDVRSDRREALRRAAVKRRAAMLIPTIGLMAPVMLLFIVAPLPGIIFGGL